MKDTSSDTLAGKLLIAMPGVNDAQFHRSVVYVCAHSGAGALGLVVNKRAPTLSMEIFFNDLDIPAEAAPKRPVYAGGPVERERGFVLHSPDYAVAEATTVINPGFAMTATRDVLEAIALGKGPARWLVALGYSGWGEGQLERELLDNAWLTLTPGPGLVFSDRDDRKWSDALNLLGVSPQLLSGASGHA